MNTTFRTAVRRLRRQQGVTLVEAAIVMAVAGIVVGSVAPSFQQARERRHVEGIAAQMETDFAYVRSLAVAQNRTLRINFADPRCYVMHAGSSTTCQCAADGSAQCTSGAEVLRVAQIAPGVPVTLQSNSASMAFDAMRGTVTPTATVKVIGTNGTTIHNVVNIMGRVRSCSPSALPGQPAC